VAVLIIALIMGVSALHVAAWAGVFLVLGFLIYRLMKWNQNRRR
jgi:hypothetical protein